MTPTTYLTQFWEVVPCLSHQPQASSTICMQDTGLGGGEVGGKMLWRKIVWSAIPFFLFVIAM